MHEWRQQLFMAASQCILILSNTTLLFQCCGRTLLDKSDLLLFFASILFSFFSSTLLSFCLSSPPPFCPGVYATLNPEDGDAVTVTNKIQKIQMTLPQLVCSSVSYHIYEVSDNQSYGCKLASLSNRDNVLSLFKRSDDLFDI